MKYRLRLLTFFLAVLSVNSGCSMVPKDPKDSTPPVVEIKLRGADGQYKTVSSATMNSTNGSLDLMCVASDPQGLSFIAMTYNPKTGACVTNTGGVSSGGTIDVQGLPESQVQPINGDSSGKVPTNFGLMSTLKGPLSCQTLNMSQPGYPSTVTVECAGKNWSADDQKKSAATKLEVSLK